MIEIEYYREEVREKYKELFEHSLDLIYVNDLNGNFLDASDLTLIALGIDREDIPNISFIDLLDRDNLIKAYKVMKEIRKTGKQSAQSEYKLKTKMGDYIYVETYGIPLKKDGEIYAILGVAKNITERKKAEKKLKESADMFKALYKEGSIPAYTWKNVDGDFVLINYNNAAAKITQGGVENYLGNKSSEMYKDRVDIINDLHLCLNDKIHVRREMNYRFQFSNEEKYLLVNYSYVDPDLIVVRTEDITERKKAEERLKESELKYRNMINNLDVGFYQVTLDGIILNHNPAHNKILEYDPSKSLIGKKVTDFWQFPEDREQYLEQILRDNYVKNFVCPSLTKNGKKVVVQLNSHLMLDKKGNLYGIEGTFIDITEKYKLEEKLKESELKYRNMINNLDVGFYQVTLDGIILNHNPAHNKILEYDLSESLIGKKVTDFWQFPEDREQYLEQILRDNYTKNFVCPSLTKNGKKVVVQLNSHLMLDKKGNPYGIEGTFIDITEKYKLEEKLRESEKIYHNLYDNTPFSVVLINTQGVVVDMNPKAEEMFGYDRNELVGKKFMNLSIIHQDHLPNLLTLFRKFVKGEKLHRMDVKINRKDGVVFWANLQAALTKIKDKTYVQALFTDVTAKKEVEILIEKEVKKLKELDQIRKNLISRVSHELKTPLVSVSGGCELLLTIYGEQFSKEELEIIKLIEKGGKRLKHLVDNLIDISRIDYEKFKILKKPNDLSAIIREISKELNFSIKDRKINLMLLLPESFQINLDLVRIEQVIMNLLSNAIKNTPPNGEIVIKLIHKDNFAEFSIHDTGIGISPKEMDMLFTKFGKLERYGEGYEFIDIQGTGLGLFISKEIVDSHEGEIRAESEGRNKGSTFIVRLPIT